jgi:hypothetical protein
LVGKVFSVKSLLKRLSLGYKDYAVFNQRLGNMALVSSQDNMAQEPFSEKKPKISQTKYQINDINSYSDWYGDAVIIFLKIALGRYCIFHNKTAISAKSLCLELIASPYQSEYELISLI